MPLAQRGGFFVGTLALAALLVSPAAAETIESVTKPFYAKFGSPWRPARARVYLGCGHPSRRTSPASEILGVPHGADIEGRIARDPNGKRQPFAAVMR